VISVLVANDHPVVREHLADAIRLDERLELAGEAGDGTEALLKVEEQRPDSVILDVAIRVLDGAAVLERLRELHLPTRVLLLSGNPNVPQMRNALRHAPDSLLLMDTNAEQICQEVVAIENGVMSSGRLNLERAQLLASNRVELSGREREVLKLSAEGLTRAEIGRNLGFGPSTVRDIRRDICTKLGASSMQVAIVAAMKTGLLE
jgi:DNA-binding NarL/FixJ family response regulator